MYRGSGRAAASEALSSCLSRLMLELCCQEILRWKACTRPGVSPFYLCKSDPKLIPSSFSPKKVGAVLHKRHGGKKVTCFLKGLHV